MHAAVKTGLIAICTVGFVLSSGASVPEPNGVGVPEQQAPKKLLFLTHAGLYKHTSLGPAERAVARASLDAARESGAATPEDFRASTPLLAEG